MHWNDIEEIAEKLEEEYSDEEIPKNLPYLKEMVLSLSGFEDHEVDVEDINLKKIQEYWFEIRN